MIRKFWRFGVLIAAIAMIVGFSSAVHAAEAIGAEEITINADETYEDDLFLNGNSIEMNGTVLGDLFANGSDVVINGRVEGNVFAAGQEIILNGEVEGNAFVGGYALAVGSNADVARTVYFGGYSFIAEPGSEIGRSLYMGGYQAGLNGTIGRDVNIGSGALELTGTVGGDLNGEVTINENQNQMPPQMFGAPDVPTIPAGLNIADESTIGGAVNVEETVATQEAAPTFGEWDYFAPIVGEFITFMLVGLLVLAIRPSWVNRPALEIGENPLPSIGYGLLITILGFIAIPILLALIIALAFLIGSITFGQFGFATFALGSTALGVFTAVFLFTLNTMSKVVLAFFIGRFILTRLSGSLNERFMLYLTALTLGALLYVILQALPFVGWAVALVVSWLGLGAIYLALRQRPSLAKPAMADSGEMPMTQT